MVCNDLVSAHNTIETRHGELDDGPYKRFSLSSMYCGGNFGMQYRVSFSSL